MTSLQCPPLLSRCRKVDDISNDDYDDYLKLYFTSLVPFRSPAAYRIPNTVYPQERHAIAVTT